MFSFKAKKSFPRGFLRCCENGLFKTKVFIQENQNKTRRVRFEDLGSSERFWKEIDMTLLFLKANTLVFKFSLNFWDQLAKTQLNPWDAIKKWFLYLHLPLDFLIGLWTQWQIELYFFNGAVVIN